jgi:hypothetical protein
MENNYYLSIGTKLGGHYEIEKVLSEDEFEILYLAKDLHKRGEYVVLKELFLKPYSLREDKEVHTLAKSRIIFEETKKEVIKEVEELLSNPSNEQISTYGTFIENNTVYTIMEFINDSNVDGYLKINKVEEPNIVTNSEPLKRDVMKEEIIEPTPKKRASVEKKEKPKSSIFIKILITTLLICLALGFYAYNMLKNDKIKGKDIPTTTMVKEEPKDINNKSSNLPITKKDVINDYVEGSNEIKEEQEEESQTDTPEGAEYITNVEAYKKEQEAKRAKKKAEEKAVKEEERLRQEKEIALEDEEERLREEEYKRLEEENLKNEQKDKEFVPKDIREFMGEEESSNHPENDVPSPFKNAEENLPLGAVKPNSLGTKINNDKKNSNLLGTKIGEKNSKKETAPTTNKQAIKQFLNNFIRISGDGSIDEILSNYDDDVERYFSLRNVNHNTIRRDKTNYHNKWTHRKFELVNFDVTKVYKNGDETFYDIKTATNWSVSNDEGKSIAGTSNGIMTLRKTYDGFKVTSIYTTK